MKILFKDTVPVTRDIVFVCATQELGRVVRELEDRWYMIRILVVGDYLILPARDFRVCDVE